MAGIFLKLGPVQSAKTMICLSTVYNYKDRNQKVLLMRPRHPNEIEASVESHVGISAPCQYLDELPKMDDIDLKGYDCIVIDDCHLAKKQEVDKIVYIADILNVPVVCYGLKTNYLGELFAGTKMLIENADKIEEIKAVCWCGKKATHNLAIDSDGKPVRKKTVDPDLRYVALCRKHFHEGNLG